MAEKSLSALGISAEASGGAVGGQWLETEGKTLNVTSPVDRRALATVKECAPGDVAKVIDAAHEAYLKWRLVPGPKRGEFVRRVGEQLLQLARHRAERRERPRRVDEVDERRCAHRERRPRRAQARRGQRRAASAIARDRDDARRLLLRGQGRRRQVQDEPASRAALREHQELQAGRRPTLGRRAGPGSRGLAVPGDETRRVLELFGAAVTSLEEAIDRRRPPDEIYTRVRSASSASRV